MGKLSERTTSPQQQTKERPFGSSVQETSTEPAEPIPEATWDGDAFEPDEIEREREAARARECLHRLVLDTQAEEARVERDRRARQREAWRKFIKPTVKQPQQQASSSSQQAAPATKPTPPPAPRTHRVRPPGMPMFMPPPPEAYAASILGIYEEYAPHLMPIAPYMLEMFRGHEKLLMTELQHRYMGKGRKRTRDDEEDVQFVHYLAEKLAEAEQSVEACPQQEEDKIRQL